MFQPGGDTERGQRAAARAYSTHHHRPTEGTPCDPHIRGCSSPGIPRCASPGGGNHSQATISSPLPIPPPQPRGYQDVISLRFPLQSWKTASRCSQRGGEKKQIKARPEGRAAAHCPAGPAAGPGPPGTPFPRQQTPSITVSGAAAAPRAPPGPAPARSPRPPPGPRLGGPRAPSARTSRRSSY